MTKDEFGFMPLEKNEFGPFKSLEKNEFGIKVHPYEVRTFVQFLNKEFGTEIKVGELTNPSEPVDLVCPECNKGFESKRGLTQHIDRVHYLSNEFHHCDKCEYKTRYRKNLEKHICSFEKPPKPPKLPIHVCDECGKAFTTRKNLYRHGREVHYGAELFCTQCDYQTKRPQGLREHIARHHTKSDDTTAKPMPLFTCDHCGYQTNYKQSLKNHIDALHIIAEWKCHLCDFVTSTKKKLREHQQHHGETFECEVCFKQFPTVKKFKAHTRKGHKSKELKHCEFCKYNTTSSKCFEKHLLNKHGINKSD